MGGGRQKLRRALFAGDIVEDPLNLIFARPMTLATSTAGI